MKWYTITCQNIVLLKGLGYLCRCVCVNTGILAHVLKARRGFQVSGTLLYRSQPCSFQSVSLTKPGTKLVDIKTRNPPVSLLHVTGLSDTYMVILKLLCG